MSSTQLTSTTGVKPGTDPVPAQVVAEQLRPIDRSAPEGPHVLTIKVGAETPSRPQRVLEAARDFSDRRADVWPNVRARHLEVHQRGENFAEVTEGTWVVGLFWERNRYEWSEPGSVKATVIDSNIFQPGSTCVSAPVSTRSSTPSIRRPHQRTPDLLLIASTPL